MKPTTALRAFRCQTSILGPIIVLAESASGARNKAYLDWRETHRKLNYLSIQVRRAPEEDHRVEDYVDPRLYWKDTPKYARLLAQAEAFNAAYGVGTPVLVVGCDEATTVFNHQRTRTRTPAWVPSLNGVLVSVEGQAGGFNLKYIQPLASDAATTQS